MYDPFSDGHVLTSVVIFDTRLCYSSSSRYMKLFYVKDDISLDFLIRKGYDGRRLAECFSPILILQTMEPIIIAARNCTSIYIYMLTLCMAMIFCTFLITQMSTFRLV